MKKLLPILILALMVGIFLFSAQESTESAEVSSDFSSYAARLIYWKFPSYTDEVQKIISHGLVPFIRKLAHFMLYAVMGTLCYLWLCRLPHSVSTSMGICALYAAIDEFHQLFVSGRAGRLSDVLLDCTGAASGIGAAFLLLCLHYCLTHKTVVERGVWKK